MYSLSVQDSLLINESAVFQTPALLAVEVVSPEAVERNYRFKRSLLAALLIPEYWIIDPVEDVTILLLGEGFYDPNKREQLHFR